MSVSPSAASHAACDRSAPGRAGRGSACCRRAELDLACSEFGFFYLVGHDVDPQLSDRLLQLSREFFARG
jgi:hypothetical protein